MSALDCARVEVALRRQTLNWVLDPHDRCGSTQDLARTAVDRGAPEGLVMLAEEQCAGRGRHGGHWRAPPSSSLLLSMVLRPPAAVMAVLPLLAGVAVVDAVLDATGIAADLKWPNDVIVAGQKLAGILGERPPGGAVVLGIGVNVNLSRDQLPAGSLATSLALELGADIPRERVLASLLNHLDQGYGRTLRDGTAWVISGWRSRSRMLGRRVAVTVAGRRRPGVVEDLSPEGALLVHFDAGGREPVIAGDVELIRILDDET